MRILRPLSLGVAAIAATVTLLLSAGAALADPLVTTLKLAPGQGGPAAPGGGPGNEQPDIAVFSSGGKTYATMVFMSSDVADGPWQCKCSSVLMDPVIGPVLIIDRKQLTNNGGSRPCNHPRIAATVGSFGLWAYASNDVGGNTRTYIQGINEKCETLTDRLRISSHDAQNEGSPELKSEGGGTFIAAHVSTANVDADASYAVGIAASEASGALSVKKTWETKVVAPANIGRPAIASVVPGRALFCAAQGMNRPPEEGVACALLDTVTGTILDKQMIAPSDPAANKFMNQPSVASLGNGQVAVQVFESEHTPGTGASHLWVYDTQGDKLAQVTGIDGAAAIPAHASICAGSYGEAGDLHVAVMQASTKGIGLPMMSMVQLSGTSLTYDPVSGSFPIGMFGDSGQLSKIYGSSGDRGRDYLRCVGGVKNPGFGQAGGFAPKVETFFFASFCGQDPNEPKNALYLSILAGKGKNEPVQGSSSASVGGAGGAAGAGGAGDSGAGGNGGTSVTGCSCRMGEVGSGSDHVAALVALGAGSLTWRRRAARRARVAGS